MADVPVVIKIADDGNHETFQINHQRYLSSVQVPEREQDQAYVATESWITSRQNRGSHLRLSLTRRESSSDRREGDVHGGGTAR